MTATRIAINGAAGRMGKRLVALAAADAELQVTAALEHAAHPALGSDAGSLAGIDTIGVPLSAELTAPVDAVIDFSVPPAAEAAMRICLDRQIPLVMATTGLSDAQQQLVRQTAERTAVCWAPNMSLAVNLTMKLASIAAAALKTYPSGADVEIIERHHRFKEDAPSGTALKFGELIAQQMGQTDHVHGRQGRPGARNSSEIGYHAVRVGDDPGQHTIVFGLLGETVELRVAATNRDAYATGALTAAKYIATRPAGLYDMFDVLGL